MLILEVPGGRGKVGTVLLGFISECAPRGSFQSFGRSCSDSRLHAIAGERAIIFIFFFLKKVKMNASPILVQNKLRSVYL